jgi:hypothetical protein
MHITKVLLVAAVTQLVGCAAYMETGEIIMLCGEKEIKAAGFSSGNISQCIAGKRKHHKKYIWSRDEPI